MTSAWVGDLVQLRGIEPEDWETFQRFDRNTGDMRRADGALVGMTSTGGVDHRAGRFMYGIAIGTEHKGRGYATEAVRLLLNFMFGERRFHKCEAGVWAFNDASIALHRKLGFTEEGRLREHEFFAGRHHDVVLFGMTAAEFAARHPFPSEI